MRNRIATRLVCAAFVAILTVMVLAGCGSKNEAAKGPNGPEWQQVTGRTGATGSSEPPPVQILTGDNTGIQVVKPTVIVAQTAQQRANLLKRQFSHGVKPERVPLTDFRTQQVIGLFMPEDDRGVIVVITDIHQEGDHVVLNAVRLLPGPGCGVPRQKPHPFHIVETRRMRTSEPAVIQVKTQKGDRCGK